MPALWRPAVLAAVLMLSGCQEDGPVATQVESGGDFGETLFEQRRAACLDDGGRWGADGPAGTFVCYTPTPDANKRCTTGTDCVGLCLARSRTCAPVTPFLGCHETITDGGFPATVCVE